MAIMRHASVLLALAATGALRRCVRRRRRRGILASAGFFEFPWQSHGAIRSACAQGVIESFIDDPALVPAPDCIADEPELTFVGPNAALPQLQIQTMVMTAPIM